MWSSDVNNNIATYYDTLGELYDKYNTSGKPVAPELKLLMGLICSAGAIQMHKGIASYVANSTDTKMDTNTFADIKKQREKEEELKKEKIDEYFEKKQKLAGEQINAYNLLKRQEKDYNDIKDNTKNMPNMRNTLILSDTTTGTNKKKIEQQYKQMQQANIQLVKQRECIEKQRQMNEELQKLENINKMIEEMKSEHSKKSSYKSKSPSSPPSSSSSSSPSLPSTKSENTIKSTSSIKIKNPNIEKILEGGELVKPPAKRGRKPKPKS